MRGEFYPHFPLATADPMQMQAMLIIFLLKCKGIVPCPTTTIINFWVISIVIDSDRGHCCEHLKKTHLQWKLSASHVFECLCMWWKMKFWTFQAQPVWVRVISTSILCVGKCCFREISMIKLVILDQSASISLILKSKISKICKLSVYYS